MAASQLLELQSQVTALYRPTVMVAASSDASAIMAKNRLTLTQLLLPFGLQLFTNPGMHGTFSLPTTTHKHASFRHERFGRINYRSLFSLLAISF
jgi:hypothetical protein